jgi:ligand-binding sensor domain-containing protein
MDRDPVSSDTLASVGYEDGLLELEFTNGRVYQYFDVPERVYQSLMAADSHGTFFNESIKGVYRYARV